MRKGWILLPLLLLAACISPEERMAMEAAQRQADMEECQKLGFHPGTTELGNCVLKLREIRATQSQTDAIQAATPPYPYYDPWGRPYWY
ncbi:MAG: hypothetical protein PW790_07805 [Parvibaculaceae bacterium]|nr:hypothetical protein [Parvibaculaceae bacterium]